MTWSSVGTQSGTDTSLASITSVTGVTVSVSPNGHRTYQVPSTVALLTVTGNLSWDSDYETLECSESTRIEVNAGASVTIGLLSTINGKPRYSAGTGLIMNRQQGSPFINTSSCNIWVKASSLLTSAGTFIVNGSRVMSGGGIFCGNSTTPTNNFVKLELNGGAVLQNISTTQQMQMVRCFCETSGININQGTLDGRTLGGIPFSNAGWGTLNLSLAYGNFQCDGNGAVAPVTVANATLAANVNAFDYAYVANTNDKTKINKYIFKNSDVGSGLRTQGQTGSTWRLGVVEITKDVVFSVQDTSNAAIQNAVTYMKLNGATLNPSAGSRYAGVDDYMTPRVYIGSTASTGLTTSANVLYAVAQGYATDATGAGTALTMDSLTTRASDITDGYIWSYDHLVGQPTAAMRGTGTLTQSWTMFADANRTLSRTAAIAKLASSFTVNISTKVVTVTANSTYDDLYDALKAYKCSTTQAQIETPTIDSLIVTPSGSDLTGYTGWTLAVATGVTLSAGAKFAYVYFPTVTLTGSGKITGLYGTTDGDSVTVRLQGVSATGVLCVWHPNTSATELFQTNNSGSTTAYEIYYPPGSVGLVKNYARELYGSQRVSGSITLAAGLNTISFVDIPDVGITQTNVATVLAYTSIEGPSKRYDRTAAFRLTEQGIKLGQIATRSGTSLEGTFSVVVRDDAPAVFAVVGNVMTIKAASYDADNKFVKEIVTGGGTFTAFDTELIGIDVEDANGDSSVNVQGTVGGLVDVWKCVNGTINADYATGTKIASNISAGKFRFTGTSGFKLIFYDKNSLLARDCSMNKGNYVLGWYVYDAATGGLTQSQNTDFATLVSKVNDIFADVNSVTAGFAESTDSLHALRQAVDTKPTLAEITATTLNANIVQVNDVPVSGTGAEGDEWGPSA